MTELPPTVWRRRWKLLKISLWLSAAEVGCATGYAIWTSRDNPLLANITIAVIGYATAASLGYIFGATWDDSNQRKHEVDLALGKAGLNAPGV